MNSSRETVRAIAKCHLLCPPRNAPRRAIELAVSRKVLMMNVLPGTVLSSRMFIIEYDMAIVEKDAVISIVSDENFSYSHTAGYS